MCGMTHNERQKIIEDEILRGDVQQSLKKKSIGFWEFINSQFGNWILTSVVVGGLSFLINYMVQSNKDEHIKENRIKALDMEIEGRISQFWVHLEKISIKQNDTAYFWSNSIPPDRIHDTLDVFWKAFKNAPCSECKTTIITSIIDEFDKRNIVSLMYELSSLVEKTEAQKIFKSITYITGDGIFYFNKVLAVRELWQSFRENIIQDRWDKSLPYTDCLFC
jgi:hypothetical protein